jgi:hypothetical protein
MSNIPVHVQKIAQRIAKDPVKLAACTTVFQEFTKTAGKYSIFGGTELTGAQKVLGAVAGGAGVALLGAAGLAVKNQYDQLIAGMPTEAHTEANKELGRMHARASFMNSRATLLSGTHTKILKELLRTDSVISGADKDVMASSFTTMTTFAPNLAADINAARSFLRASAESGSGPSFATLQTLADAERSIMQVGGITGGGK